MDEHTVPKHLTAFTSKFQFLSVFVSSPSESQGSYEPLILKFYSLRKHPFLLALRRWGRFAAAKSEEKRMFSQAKKF